MDISKCFDQVNRQLLEQLAKDAGMDLGVLSAYLRYQEGLQIHNSIAGGIGRAFCRRTGIPQGCPLSMLFVTLMLRPWLVMQAREGNFAYTLADDMMLFSIGKFMTTKFSKALKETHLYLQRMGAVVSPTKKFNFASTTEARKWLRKLFGKLSRGQLK